MKFATGLSAWVYQAGDISWTWYEILVHLDL